MKKLIIKVLLVILWMGVIFCFSNQVSDDSTKLSDNFIKNTICKINNSNCDITIEKSFKPVRKCAHFFVYFILGILVMNCFNIDKKYIVYSLLICLLYSISDEVHQLFVHGRSGEVLDVLIDSVGSFMGIGCLYKFKSR